MAIKTSSQISIVDISDGVDGDTGKGVSSVTPEYYLSTSKTTQTGGSWSTTPPTWSSGKYLWVRQIVTYTDSSVSRTQPYCDTSWEAVNDVQVGGTNIATGTATMTIGTGGHSVGHWRKSGTGTIETIDISDAPVASINKGVRIAITSASSQIGICQDNLPLNSGDIYTLSCWIRSNSSSGVPCRLQPFYKSSTDNSGATPDITITDSWKRISFVSVRSPQTTGAYSGSYIYLRPTEVGNYIDVCGIKFEVGNKPTDWSPAPEDVDSDIDEAAKTATNYMNFDDNGLVIGDMTAGTLGKNVLIDADSVDIRKGDTVLASYGDDIIWLGKSSSSSAINLCNGTGYITSTSNSSFGRGLTIASSNSIYICSNDNTVRLFSNDTSTGYISDIIMNPTNIQITNSSSVGNVMIGTNNFYVYCNKSTITGTLYIENGSGGSGNLIGICQIVKMGSSAKTIDRKSVV